MRKDRCDFARFDPGVVMFFFVVFFISAYVARPVSVPVIEAESLLTVSGKPRFDKLPSTKSSPSGVYFYVNETNVYCGVGVVQGADDCFYIEELIDRNRDVTVRFSLMPNRLGFQYPLLYSLEQNSVTKVTPQLANSRTQISVTSAWKNYYFCLSLFGFTGLFLFAVEKLQSHKKPSSGLENSSTNGLK